MLSGRKGTMKVKELMIPVSEYMTFGSDAVLSDVVVAMSESKHKDALILNEKGNLRGVLTMAEVLGELEPSYKKLKAKGLDKDTLTHEYVADIFKEFGLWADSLNTLCQNACNVSVLDAMHVPEKVEYLDEDDDLEHGVHNYVVGVHQPLIVRKNGEVTGVLRLSDIFEEVKKRMVACNCEL